MNKFYSFENKTETSADLYIYGTITSYEWDDQDVSAWGFKKELEDLGEVSEINVHINSYGGSTFEGLAIYNQLKQHKAKINIYVDGIAASSASIIAMAGDKIYMPKTAIIMIHNCWTGAVGNAKELRKTADDMDKIATAYKEAYLAKVNITKERLEELLDEESYLTAQECIDMGFADEIIELKINNSINQDASMCLYKLVNKLKQLEKQSKAKVIKDNIDEDTINKIAEKTAEQITKKIQQEGKQDKHNNKQNQDTLVVSFLKDFLK